MKRNHKKVDHTPSRMYHLLAVKEESKTDPWVMHFGDYDREAVAQERSDVMQHPNTDDRPCAAKLLTVYSDGQADINKALDNLNGVSAAMH